MVIANFSQISVKENGKRKLWQPSDFIPDPLEDTEKKQQEVKKQTVDDHKTMMLAFVPREKKNKTQPKKQPQRQRKVRK